MNEESTKILPWHHQNIQDVLQALETQTQGLSDHEVKARLEEHGPNELPHQPPKSAWRIFVAQFTGPLMVILLLAATISLVLVEWLDFAVIMAAVLMNTTLGFFEEYKADRSLAKLKEFLPQRVRVRRAGQVETVPAAQVVPGDIMLIGLGDRITADGRVLVSHSLEVNEAPLTGESTPVHKVAHQLELGAQPADQLNMAFAGTVAVHGRAEVVVTETGLRTQIGQITKLVLKVEDEETPLQAHLRRLARLIGGVILVLTGIVYIIGIAEGVGAVEMFKIAVAIAVSAVPEGLVVAVTVILAIGMQRILKQQALVRRLVAAETLGSVSIICADKTGTLTTGVMSVDELRLDSQLLPLRLAPGEKPDELRRAIALADASVREFNPQTGEHEITGSQTEVVIGTFVNGFREQLDDFEKNFISEILFDSSLKFSARLYEFNGKTYLSALGAPDFLLERADVSDRQRREFTAAIEQMTQDGLRVLMVAVAHDIKLTDDLDEAMVKDLSVLGLIGLRDPLRAEAAQTIAEARQAGLRPIMITGDHPETARVIAAKVGFDVEHDGIVTGAELDNISDPELQNRISDIDVYARVSPKHKLRIVKAWQARGFSVAMTGDGVNDAPAIKAADIGIALGSGTEVAKETADLVLLDNNFKIIVQAIREGRIIFDNLRKVIVYLLSDSFSELILILGSLVLHLPIPILPAQILWINLITDGFPSVALTFEPGEKGIMRDPPRAKNEPIINGEMKVLIILIGLLTDAILFAIYFYLLQRGTTLEEVRTFVFVALGLDSLMYVFAVRKFRSSIFRSHPFENKFLIGGVALGLVLQFAPLLIAPLRELFAFTSLTTVEWIVLVALAVMELVLIEIVKEIYNLRRNRQQKRALSQT